MPDKTPEQLEAELYNATEAARRLRELDAEVEELQQEIERRADQHRARQDALDMQAQMELIDHLGEYLAQRDPVVANRMLSNWIREIRIHPHELMVIKRWKD